MSAGLAQFRWIALVTLTLPLACGEQPGADARSLGLPPPPAELEAMAAELFYVCDNGFLGDERRAVFDPTAPGPHSLLFIASDGTAHALNNVLPKEWRPVSADTAELVACVGDVEPHLFEQCDYLGTSAKIRRMQQGLRVNLVAAHSGSSTPMSFFGDEPDYCPGSTNTWYDIVGGLPHPEQVKADLADRYVLLPDCGASRPLASCLHCFRDAEEATPSGCGTPSLEYSEKVGPVRTGESVALDWHWETYTTALYEHSFGFDWSASPDGSLLASLQGTSTSFVPSTERAYTFVAQARLPATDTGWVTQTRQYTVEALDKPIVQSVGVSEPQLVRAGEPARFTLTIQGRPYTGRFGESFRWAWVQRPEGSSDVAPSVELASSLWSFTPTLTGDYRVQLEYDDGAGFSEPFTSSVITAIDHPIVTGLRDITTPVSTHVRVEATVSYAVGAPSYHWSLLAHPAEDTSLLDFSTLDYPTLVFFPEFVGDYVFEFTVSDRSGQSEPVRFTITVVEASQQ